MEARGELGPLGVVVGPRDGGADGVCGLREVARALQELGADEVRVGGASQGGVVGDLTQQGEPGGGADGLAQREGAVHGDHG